MLVCIFYFLFAFFFLFLFFFLLAFFPVDPKKQKTNKK